MKDKHPLRSPSLRFTFTLVAVALILGIMVGLKFLPQTSQNPQPSVVAPGISTTQPDLSAAATAAPLPIESDTSGASTQIVATDEPQARPEAPHGAEQQAAFEALPESEQASLWKAFGEAQRKIRPLTAGQKAQPRNEGVHFFAGNPGQQLTARFLDGAVRVESGRSGAWAGTLSLVGGAQVTPVVAGDRAEFHHPDGVTEWYVNQPEGIEHGFTLANRPTDAMDGEVRMNMDLEGLTARAVDGEAALEFIDEATGDAVLRYDKLLVWDATGRELPARLEGQGGDVSILVADSGAAYPLTIDPLITSLEAKLLALEDTAQNHFGESVALSSSTALVGAPDDDAMGVDSGSAYVFTRSGTTWSQQAKLVPADGAASDQFGISVAISSSTALVGAEGDDDAGLDSGSVYVFTRLGSDWTQQTKLVAGDPEVNQGFGYSVAISGNTALVGRRSSQGTGTAYVFVRSGTNWSQQQKLVSPVGSHINISTSVALSGNTALVGWSRLRFAGRAHIFVLVGSVWTLQAELERPDVDTADSFGYSVALAGDTAIIGAPFSDEPLEQAGSAYVFARNGSVWTQEAKLVAQDGEEGDQFGFSVALSGDTALIGARFDDDDTIGANSGSVYVFERIGIVWSQQVKLLPPVGSYTDNFGSSVALFNDTALIGMPSDDTAGGNAGSALVFTRSGSAWSQEATLLASDAAANDDFGYSVAVLDNRIHVGAPRDDDMGIDSGSVYPFYLSTHGAWQSSGSVKYFPDDGQAGDSFGSSVALYLNYALVGASLDDDSGADSGSAYVFLRNGDDWLQEAKLVASDGAAGDFFGYSVDVDLNRALVGAYNDDDLGSNSGSAYVFVYNGSSWSQETKLVASDGAAGDFFGYSVALDNARALVGAYSDDDAGFNSGSAYVFTRSGSSWSQHSKLVADDGSASDWFGYSVDLYGSTALVGAYADDDAGTSSGSAYVFVHSTEWSQQAKLVADDAAASDEFGRAVSISGDKVLIGATRDDDAGSSSGSAYVFTRSGTAWSQSAKFVAADGAAADFFGHSVALYEDTAVVGSRYDDVNATNSGSAYVFRLFPTDISVEQPTDTLLVDGAASIDFGAMAPGSSSAPLTFTIRNPGGSDLTPIVIMKSGAPADTAPFTVNTTGTLTELEPSNSTTFTVSFAPVGAVAVTAQRSATLQIASNALGAKNPFDIELTGTALSSASDTDLDGLNDAAEFRLSGLGFDWEVGQPSQVTSFLTDNALFNQAQYDANLATGVTTGQNNVLTDPNAFDLYSLSQVQALNIDSPLLQRDGSGQFMLTIGIKKSTSLLPGSFQPFPMTTPQTTINGDGKLEFQFNVSDDAAFFRLETD